jgi:hypothetical protein
MTAVNMNRTTGYTMSRSIHLYMAHMGAYIMTRTIVYYGSQNTCNVYGSRKTIRLMAYNIARIIENNDQNNGPAQGKKSSLNNSKVHRPLYPPHIRIYGGTD